MLRAVLAHRPSAPICLLGLALLLAGLLWLLPPEQTLGPVIKAVFLHGALVQAGLVAFAAAGLLGLAYLLVGREALYRWCLAVQETAVVLWLAYGLTSLVATYLAWGVAVAWGEPRVQVSLRVMAACLLFLLLTRWAGQRTFTALLNVALAALAWGLVKGAGLVRHPLDPVGSSDSAVLKAFFAAILAVVLLMGLQVARWRQLGSCEGRDAYHPIPGG